MSQTCVAGKKKIISQIIGGEIHGKSNPDCLFVLQFFSVYFVVLFNHANFFCWKMFERRNSHIFSREKLAEAFCLIIRLGWLEGTEIYGGRWLSLKEINELLRMLEVFWWILLQCESALKLVKAPLTWKSSIICI